MKQFIALAYAYIPHGISRAWLRSPDFRRHELLLLNDLKWDIEELESIIWTLLGPSGDFAAAQHGVPEVAPWADAPTEWGYFDHSLHAFLGLRAARALPGDAGMQHLNASTFLEGCLDAKRAGPWSFTMIDGVRHYDIRRPERARLPSLLPEMAWAQAA